MSALTEKLNGPESPASEEVAACQLCGSSESDLLFSNVDRLFHRPGKFGVVRCRECGLVRLSPRPRREEIDFYYPDEGYYTYNLPSGVDKHSFESSGMKDFIRDKLRDTVISGYGYPVSLNPVQTFIQPIANRLFLDLGTRGWRDKLPRYVPNGRALDIGCGSGTFLAALKSFGWRTVGIEMNEQAANLARKRFGLDVRQGMIEDLPEMAGKFDYVNISHVLEHIYEPQAFLQKVKDVLAPDGIVYFELPNFESYGRRTSREFWYPWETPRHVYMYSPETLRKQLAKAGFAIDRMRTAPGNLWIWDETYREEDAAGEKLDPRPSASPKIAERARTLAKNAAEAFRRDPLSGDIISCWATSNEQ